MSDLPNGWTRVSTCDCFQQISTTNKKVKTKECKLIGAFPVVDQGALLIAGYVDNKEKLVTSDKPVVVFGDHTRTVKWVDFPFVPGADGTKLLVPSEFVEPRYFYYQLKSIELPDRGYSRHFQFLKASEFCVAPFTEQKRIADKLDRLLARVDTAKARLDKIPALLKRLHQAILAAATTGKLTEEWREENSVTDYWREVTLSDLGAVGRGKSKHRPRNAPELYGGQYPFIQTGQVAQSRGVITSHNQTYNELGLKQSKLWPKDTVCITIAANIADTAILTYPACFPDSVVGFVADPKVSVPKFVKWSIDAIRSELEMFAPATAQKNINLAVLHNVLIRCPSLTEQREIVRRVEELFVITDRIEAQYRAARTRVDRLTQSLLAKAFRGELVPQDPSDEPAPALLERIRAQRAAADKPKRSRYRKAAIQELPMVAEEKGSYTRKMSRRSQAGKKSK